MSTIKEVARRARVSVGTASHVLNGKVPVSDELRKRVERAIAALDYHPSHIARSLSTRRTDTLGMVIPDINNPFFPQIIRGAESIATRLGFSMITFNTDDQLDREKDALNFLRSRRVDGILLTIAPGRSGREHIRATLKAGIPIVCLDRIPYAIDLDTVSVDNFAGSREAVRHLISMGHQRIAIITGPLSLKNARDRVRGYRAALEGAGLAYVPEMVAEGDFRQGTGLRLCHQLFEEGKQRPSALFISNNLMALGALEALRDLGLTCPNDVAVVTFDGFVFPDVFQPTITTVVQAAFDIGARGAEILIERLNGELKLASVRVELPTQLHLKESSQRNFHRETEADGCNRRLHLPRLKGLRGRGGG